VPTISLKNRLRKKRRELLKRSIRKNEMYYELLEMLNKRMLDEIHKKEMDRFLKLIKEISCQSK
jgi:hypothetical protein